MNYNINHFIAKFEAIPEDKWITGVLADFTFTKFCALGHCGVLVEKVQLGCNIKYLSQGDEAEALSKLFCSQRLSVSMVNDGASPTYQQATPKQRILAFLYDFKAAEAVKQAEAIIQNPVEIFAV